MAYCACPDCRAEYNCPGELPLERSHARLLQKLYDQESMYLGMMVFVHDAALRCTTHEAYKNTVAARRYWQGGVAATQTAIELMLAEQRGLLE